MALGRGPEENAETWHVELLEDRKIHRTGKNYIKWVHAVQVGVEHVYIIFIYSIYQINARFLFVFNVCNVLV